MIPRGEMYDVSRDVGKRFGDEFKKYVAEQKYVATRLLVNSGWAFEHADGVTSGEYRRVVDEVILPIKTSFGGAYGSLIQFWRAEEIIVNNSVGERLFLLTLRNQPFLLQGPFLNGTIGDKLCCYRTKMHDVIVNGDETGGPIGRVFLNNRIEFTPHVSFYSDNEYPQRDIALSCGVRSSLVLLWRDYYRGVVGAIECVSLVGLPLLLRIPLNMLCSNSCYPDYCIRLCGQYDLEKDSLISALIEINEVIEEVCERCDVVRCAQTWMLCKHCNSLSTVKRCAEELKSSPKYFTESLFDSIFLEYQDYYNLKKGEGVVGKAAESSHDLVYCEDVAKFRITQYLLAHIVRDYGLSASFAIRLQSNQTGDQVYVLEFFLHPDNVKGKNLRETLVPILETMRQRSKTLKFASGGEIGDSLSVQVIDASFSGKNENFKIGGLYLMDNHLAFKNSINNGGNMASNINEIEFAITGSTEKLHNAQKLGDRGREFTIGVTDADFSEQPLLLANFLSPSRECAVMQQKFVSHDGTDVSGYFLEDFKKYVYEENMSCRNIGDCCWIFSKEHESGVVGYALHDLTNRKFDSIIECLEECLVQFWIAEERGDCSERLFQLESRNQPFLLLGSDTYDGICTYRTKMSNSIVGNRGVIGRVYRNNRMEYTSDVGYYSSEEYPHQDLAKSCGVKSSLVFPLSDLSGRPVGVCELVSPNAITPSEDLISDLSIYPNNGLKWLNRCKYACGQYDSEQISLQRAVSEIDEVMDKVGGKFDLLFGQTWMLCKSCNSLCISERCGVKLGASYIGSTVEDSFLEAKSFCILLKGEGVVGKAAATSHNLVYCEDVAKFGVTEYPLAHLAREYNLSACFALSIRSNHTGNQVYLLELFLSPDYIRDKDLREILVPILDTMKQSFRTFKFASGGELKDSVSIQVIEANSSDKFETLDIGALDLVEIHSAEVDSIDNGKDVVYTPEERDLQKTLFEERRKSFAVSGDTKGEKLAIGVSNRVDLQQAKRNGNAESMVSNIDERNVQTTAQTYADEPGRDLPGGVINFVHTDQNDIGFPDECITSPSKLPKERGGIDISLEELMQEAGKNREDAAKNLNVSISTLKRACRHHGISRWPPRKRNLDNLSCSRNSTPTYTRKTQKLSAPAVQNQSSVKIKAKYKDIFIKFDISASSGIDVFHYEVSKRLKLVVGDYTVKYQDEDNHWIMIACDDDLRDYISSPTLLGKNNLVISLERV